MNTELLDNRFKLEILISTMNRTSLSFIKSMFKHNKIQDLNILIVNQTEKGNELISEFPNIKVVNSYEKGLSKSRNLAIKNAIGDICLIADDDIEYVKGFQEIIKNAFARLNKASIIKFKISTFDIEPYKKYPKDSKKLAKSKEILSSSSIEIAFKRNDIINNNIYFNPLFGLGGQFPSGEEYLFLKEAFNKQLIIYFENSFIVKHKFERSTSNRASNNFIRAKAAIYYHNYKYLSYLLLFKLILFLLRKRAIKLSEVFEKYKVGVCAINKYIDLND